MEVQDRSEGTIIPPVPFNQPNETSGASASASVASLAQQSMATVQGRSASSSVESSPVTSYFDFPLEAEAEGGDRNEAAAGGWSGFSWASGESCGSSSFTPPSSYTPSLPVGLSRDKGKGRERPTEEDQALASSQVGQDDTGREVHGISEILEEQPLAATRGQAGSHGEQEVSSAMGGRTPEEDEDLLQPLQPSSSSSSAEAAAFALTAVQSAPITSRPPKRSRAFPFPRPLHLGSRDSTPSAEVNTAPSTPRRRFARSLSSASSSTSFLSLTPSRSKASSTGSGTSTPSRSDSKRNSNMLKALSFIRPAHKGAAAEEADSSGAERPPRLRSQSAPLLQTTSGALEAEAADAGFVTALSSPVAESPPRLAAPVELRLNLFDFLLPRELRLRILGMLVENCVEEHERDKRSGQWKGEKARQRWVGELKGRRELVRVSRVSRTWHALAFDGQHWQRVPATLFGADLLRPPFLLRLITSVGTFLHQLDLTGMGHLQPETLVEITELALNAEGTTNFTVLNLTGCHALTPASLDYLLERSPHLLEVNLYALFCVRMGTIERLCQTARRLEKLNVSRCRRLHARLVWELAEPIRLLGVPSNLRELQVSSLPHFSDDTLQDILAAHEQLQVLDISHNVALTDGAFSSAVRRDDLPPTWPTRDLKPAQKRTFALHRLNMSSLPSVTDLSFRYLAHCLPELTHLELADPSRQLHGPGLARLLGTTPHLTHLDLENAVNLRDDFLLHVPPTLRAINLSSCRTLSSDAWDPFLALHPNLQYLEADGTSIDAESAYSFVAARRAAAAGPSLLSVLDNREITRQAHKQGSAMTRPRTGQRGYWTATAGLGYHDGAEEGLLGVGAGRGGLQECDETKVVVRSFYGHAAVDAADARSATRKKMAGMARVGRRRASSEGERGMSCVVS